MHTLTVRGDSARFPDRCVECGAPPTRAYSLVLAAPAVPVAVPLCARCDERKSLGVFFWGALSVVAGIAAAGAVAVVLDALVPVFPALRAAADLIVIVVMVGLIAVPAYLALRRGRRAYHRRFSAAWVQQHAPGAEAVTLGFRAQDLARDVGALSSATPAHDAAAAPYRATGRTPDAFAGARTNPLPAWTLVVFGVGSACAAFAEYTMLGDAVYNVGGRVAVLALFMLVAVLSCVAGVRDWRSAQRRDAE